MIEPAALSLELAERYHVPPAFMIERISEEIIKMSDRPFLYSQHTGQLTRPGAQVVTLAIGTDNLSGALNRQLTAWSAQCPA